MGTINGACVTTYYYNKVKYSKRISSENKVLNSRQKYLK